jgi:hypothetical protein
VPPTPNGGRNNRNRSRRNFGRPNYGRQQSNNNSNNSNRRFDFATPIAVVTDFSITNLPTVQVQGPNGKFTCYVSSAESKESFLHCLTTYQSAVATAGIDNVCQRIAGLRNILDPSLTHHYDSSLATLNINLLGAADIPAARYNALVTGLKNAVFTEFDCSALCEYLSRGQEYPVNDPWHVPGHLFWQIPSRECSFGCSKAAPLGAHEHLTNASRAPLERHRNVR